MEAYRKTLVELASSILFLAALFFPSAGLVTVGEVESFVAILILVATVGAPLLVHFVPNAANWRFGRGPNLSIYRKAIASGLGSILMLLSLYWPSVGLVPGAHVDTLVGVVLTIIALFGPPTVYRVSNGAAVEA